MKTYTFDCQDIKIDKDTSILFSEDPFPTQQNCDMLIISKNNDVCELLFWYDEGSQKAFYSPAFDFIYIDSQKQSVTFWISEENKIDSGFKNGFSSIEITLQKQELLYRLKDVFAFDKMIAFEDWI